MSEATKNKKKKLHKRIRRSLKRVGVLFFKYTIPYIYVAYMWFVEVTSRIEKDQRYQLHESMDHPPHLSIAVLWHQDVFWVAWFFRHLRAYTLASVGDAGEVISKMLYLCGYTMVFRGGSSKGKKRRKKVLPEFIEYMKTVDKGIIGITVDGSSGPPYRMKTGSLVMSQALNAPIMLERAWCKRKILLPTWDRTCIPLPFNRIILTADGPFYPPENKDDQEAFHNFHRHVESKLHDITYQSLLYFGNKKDLKLLQLFPEDWKPEQQRNDST